MVSLYSGWDDFCFTNLCRRTLCYRYIGRHIHRAFFQQSYRLAFKAQNKVVCRCLKAYRTGRLTKGGPSLCYYIQNFLRPDTYKSPPLQSSATVTGSFSTVNLFIDSQPKSLKATSSLSITQRAIKAPAPPTAQK